MSDLLEIAPSESDDFPRDLPLEGQGSPAPSRKVSRRQLDDFSASSRTQKLLLVLLVVLGAGLRIQGLTVGGLWTSDAWVALSSHVGLGTAWHMWANAPGFDLFERTWLLIGPRSTWWGQMPPLGLGLCSIPAAYCLLKYFKFPAWLCLCAALIVTVSPVCVVYSTRYKEYTLDFVLACVLLGLAEGARRRPHWKTLGTLAPASVAAVAISASTLTVVVGIWVGLGFQSLATRSNFGRFCIFSGATTMGTLVVGDIFYIHLSPYLNKSWRANFFTFRAPGAFIQSFFSLVLQVYKGMFSILGGPQVAQLLLLVTLTCLIALALSSMKRMILPFSVLAAALIACGLGKIPLGTGRADEVLYPALLLILASGVLRLQCMISNLNMRTKWRRLLLKSASSFILVAVLLGGLSLSSVTHYESVNVSALANQVDQNLKPGDHVVVDAFLRYSWALYEEPNPHIVFGADWMAGFTVASTQPGVFVVPSFYIEGGLKPATWTRQLGRFKRLWLIETKTPWPNTFVDDLHRAGWHESKVLLANNCEAILLVRHP